MPALQAEATNQAQSWDGKSSGSEGSRTCWLDRGAALGRKEGADVA